MFSPLKVRASAAFAAAHVSAALVRDATDGAARRTAASSASKSVHAAVSVLEAESVRPEEVEIALAGNSLFLFRFRFQR